MIEAMEAFVKALKALEKRIAKLEEVQTDVMKVIIEHLKPSEEVKE